MTRRGVATLVALLCLLLASWQPATERARLRAGSAAACGCKPGASCCLLLAKLGKKCCTGHRHGGRNPSCSVTSGDDQTPATGPARDRSIPKASAVAKFEPFASLPGCRLERLPAATAASLTAREPPVPPPRIS